MKSLATLKLTLLIGFLLFSYVIQAKEKKSYFALGAGVASTYISDYIGSDENRFYTVPVPYIYYKSDKLTLDRNALQGEIFTSNKWHLTLDASGSIPVKSEDNQARQGMPDLDWVGEFGPSLEYYLIGNHTDAQRIYFDFSARKAIATDFTSIDDAGWTAELALKHYVAFEQDNSTFTLSSSLALRAITDSYAHYYYGVDEQYVLENRQQHHGQGGFGGVKISIGGTWRKNNLWFGVFTRYTNIEQSSFSDSPLVKSSHNVLAGLVVSYIFKER